mgnify:CR=1 FL=1
MGKEGWEESAGRAHSEGKRKESGKSSIRQKAYQTEKIPEDFLEKILERARMHIAGLK